MIVECFDLWTNGLYLYRHASQLPLLYMYTFVWKHIGTTYNSIGKRFMDATYTFCSFGTTPYIPYMFLLHGILPHTTILCIELACVCLSVYRSGGQAEEEEKWEILEV